jgi:hypothetical protein
MPLLVLPTQAVEVAVLTDTQALPVLPHLVVQAL